MHANFQKKQTTLTFSTKICPKTVFEVRISKIYVRIRNLHPWYTMCTNFQTKRTTLNFWVKFAHKLILGSELQKSGFGINTSTIPCVAIFCLNLGKLPNYVQYFGPNIEGVSESWVEAEMISVEVDGAGWRLKWAGLRWTELGLGAQFSNTRHQKWERFHQ